MSGAGGGPERIRTALARRPSRPHLIPYLMAGYPRREETGTLLHAAQESGAAVVELGLPYSDPLADGPVIQAAGQRALAEGMSAGLALEQVARAREDGLAVPLVVMTYLNPVLRMGVESFCSRAAAAGVDALLVPDLPLEEAEAIAAAAAAVGLAFITMVAPTTPASRLTRAAALTSGFLYCVSRTGVTGKGEDRQSEGRELLRRARAITDIPLALGFGVRRPDQVSELAGVADAVVVGSALLEVLGDATDVGQALASAISQLGADA